MNRLLISKILSPLISQDIKTIETAFQPNWILIVCTIPIVLFIFVSSLEPAPLITLSRNLVFKNIASAAQRNRHQRVRIGQILLFIVSFMSIASIAYFTEVHYSLFFFQLSGIILWTANFIFIGLAVGLRHLILVIIGEFLGKKHTFDEYAYLITILYKLIGIPLLVINFFIPYFELIPDFILIFTAGIIIAIFYIFRITRIATIFINQGISFLYFILYLCALELIPVLIFSKFLIGNV